jgi:peroxiredoxin
MFSGAVLCSALLFTGCPSGDDDDATPGDDDTTTGDDDITDDDDATPGDDDDATPGDDDDSAAGDDDDATGNPVGPPNDWWHCEQDDFPAGLYGTGYEAGDTAFDFLLMDQNGDEVELYQFYGRPIVIVTHMGGYCPPCEAFAAEAQNCWQQLLDQGSEVMFVQALFGDENNQAPTQQTLEAWASTYSITHAVLADPQEHLGEYEPNLSPAFALIGPDMVIVDPSFDWNCSWIEQQI